MLNFKGFTRLFVRNLLPKTMMTSKNVSMKHKDYLRIVWVDLEVI